MSNLDTRISNLPPSVYDLVLRIDALAGRPTKPHHRGPHSLTETEQESLAEASEAAIHIDREQAASYQENDLRIMTRRDEREARAYCEVLEYILAEHDTIAITEETLCSLHEQLFRHADWAQRHRGKYRITENQVDTKDKDGKIFRVLVKGTPLAQMRGALKDLLTWYNDPHTAEAYHPLIVIIVFISEFLKIHPFADGNGRLSRMLTNLLLLQAGYEAELYYPLEKLMEDDIESYFLALSHSQKTFGTEAESILPWTEYFLGVVLTQTTRAAAIAALEA